MAEIIVRQRPVVEIDRDDGSTGPVWLPPDLGPEPFQGRDRRLGLVGLLLAWRQGREGTVQD